MSRENSHFPTFRKISSVGSHIGRGAAGAAGAGSGSAEVAFLRLALYGILVLALVHTVALRMIIAGMGGMGGYSPFQIQQGPRSSFAPGQFGWLSPVFLVTSLVLGPSSSETPILIAVLCLVGLAASSRRIVTVQETMPTEPPTTKPRPMDRPFLSEPVPPPVERHPLDPDPADLPAEPRWPRK